MPTASKGANVRISTSFIVLKSQATKSGDCEREGGNFKGTIRPTPAAFELNEGAQLFQRQMRTIQVIARGMTAFVHTICKRVSVFCVRGQACSVGDSLARSLVAVNRRAKRTNVASTRAVLDYPTS